MEYYQRKIETDIDGKGITISNKTSSDLLNAAGGTTNISDIISNLATKDEVTEAVTEAVGNIEIPTPTVKAASGTKTIWTGTQSEYEAIDTKDANTLYFITEG